MSGKTTSGKTTSGKTTSGKTTSGKTTLAMVKTMGDAALQTWLRTVGDGEVETLEKALVGADAEVRARVRRNMSARASEILFAATAEFERSGCPAGEVARCSARLEAMA